MNTATKIWNQGVSAPYGEVSAFGEANTRSLSWFEGGDIGAARKAVLENLNAAQNPQDLEVVMVERTRVIGLSEQPAVKEPEMTMTPYVRRAASVRAVVVCTLVGAWTVVEAGTTRSIGLISGERMVHLGRGIALGKQAEEQDRYPVADFYEAVDFNWSKTRFKVGKAVKAFSEQTHADY